MQTLQNPSGNMRLNFIAGKAGDDTYSKNRTAYLSMSYMKKFRVVFFKPGVIGFILLGVSFMLFTFFTQNNAMEIAISGIASIFIGIGVNNFTSFETRIKDEKKIHDKIRNSLLILELASSKVTKLHNMIAGENFDYLNTDVNEIQKFVDLSARLIKEAALLD